MNAGDPFVRCGSQRGSVDDGGFAGHDVAGGFGSDIYGSYSSAYNPDVFLHLLSCVVPAGDSDCTAHNCGWMLGIQGIARAKGSRWCILLSQY